MIKIGDEVMAGVGSIYFRGWVRTAPFIWKGYKHIVVTNAEHLFVCRESSCQHARPVLVEDIVGVYGHIPEEE